MKIRMSIASLKITRTYSIVAFIIILQLGTVMAAFVHPGCLSTQTDLDRMAAKIAANEQPWKGSWDILVANSHAQLSYIPNPQASICAGSVCDPENYMTLANDCAAAYQCALRYHISGNTQYADKAVQIMNAWSSTLVEITGDSNAGLRAGLYGYQFACAAELMRNYSGWASADFTAFKNMMLNIFYPINSDFLIRHNNTCDSHYWANWDLANMASIIAIGVLCDDQAKFDEAVAYFYSGIGEGAIGNAVHYIHPDGTGQWQESGRDQGHNTLGMSLMGPICEIAWNQGVDLYGYAGNRFLAGCEYVAKYNLWNDVPYVTYINCDPVIQAVISSVGRGTIRPGWDMLYNHYVNRKGLAANYTAQMTELVRPEGGGGDYGSTSGGFDALGFSTLTHTLDPIASGATPGALLPYVKGRQITLSWAGSACAISYNVKRSTTSGGPYTTLATVGGFDTCYVDPGLMTGTTYYYVVSANNPGGQSANSVQVAATADGQLHGTIIGTEGSFNSTGATRDTVFDGSLKNYFDGPSSVSWAGLDMGSGVSAVITQVKYCPRINFPSRMVGGKFQGSNIADFSSGVTDLFTVSTQPSSGVLTSQTISNTSSFRYVRYLSPTGGYGNVAEVQFLGNVSGSSVPAVPSGLNATAIDEYQINLTWSVSSGATSYNLKRAAISGGPYTIVANLMGTSYSDIRLTDGTTYYYVVSALNSIGQSANSAQVSAATPIAPVKLTGTIIGTAGSWGSNPSTTKEAAMDGDLNTYFDAAIATGAWVGLDFDADATYRIVRVCYAPRTGYASRMVGGIFQGSTTADFSSGVTDLFTISTLPTEGIYTLVDISEATEFSYVRYLSAPNGYCNVAEVEFYRQGDSTPDTTPPAAPTGLTATAGNATVALNWADNSEPDLASYNVKRGTVSGGPYTTIASGLTTSAHTDNTVTNGTTYYYVVSAVDTSNNESTSSSQVSATPQAAVPTFVAAGTVTSGTGTISPALPSGTASGDILLLFVETANQAVSISNSNGGTWAEVTNSPQGTGTAAGTSATRLTVFWSRYNGTQGNPTVSDSGNHQLGRMIAIRGATASGNPWDVTAGGIEATSDTSGSIAGATTTVANTLVVVAIATSLPDSTSTTRFSAWTNANLTSLTERTDNSVTAGNGGGLGIATGIKATAGAYGNTAVTLASSATKGMISIAVKN